MGRPCLPAVKERKKKNLYFMCEQSTDLKRDELGALRENL